MRTLERNKTELWIVNPTGTTEVVDLNGNYTGDTVQTFSAPVKIRLSIYPAYSKVSQEIFGVAEQIDMLAVAETEMLGKDTLIFYTEPTSDFRTTYDFIVQQRKRSINGWLFGLKGRTKL